MTQYSKYNVIYRLQKLLDSGPGQTFMNYAYSWGASIVILGALFKLTHLPGANMMLFIGMGTEVFVFIVAGFERVTERVPENNAAVQSAAIVEQPVASVEQPLATVEQPLATVEQPSCNMVSPELFEATDPSSVEEAIKNYAEELKELTSVLTRVREQAARMGEDSEEMDNLNRTVTGISTVYELQLRSLSKQVSTIEQIDEQTRRMAENINELNNVYARMIQALTVNMQAAAPKA